MVKVKIITDAAELESIFRTFGPRGIKGPGAASCSTSDVFVCCRHRSGICESAAADLRPVSCSSCSH